MAYALKVADDNSLVKAYYVDSQSQDNHVHVIYTDKPDLALSFDDIEEAALHLMFIWSNVSRTDSTANSICIAEAQTYYKEL